MDRFEIRIAGFGGQGVVTIGKTLGRAFSIYESKNSINTQSYGPESRGGACRSEIIVADGEINYPYVRNADVFVALSQVAHDTYIDGLRENGTLVIDPDSVLIPSDGNNFKIVAVPTLRIAQEVGSIKYQNSVALGALSTVLGGLISLDSLKKALSDSVPKKTVPDNCAALEKGRTYVLDRYFKGDINVHGQIKRQD